MTRIQLTHVEQAALLRMLAVARETPVPEGFLLSVDGYDVGVDWDDSSFETVRESEGRVSVFISLNCTMGQSKVINRTTVGPSGPVHETSIMRG